MSTAPQTASAPADHAVEVDHLSFAYADRRALDDISFAVERGEIFSFLGPNGSGKSTLFRLLSTWAPMGEGTARILGRDVRGNLAAVRRLLGVVFQSPAIDLELTAEENLRFAGALYGLGGSELTRRVAEELERFSLGARGGERAKALSGGMRRRLELAKCLLHRPEVLLLDEPSTGLDPSARRRLWDTLANLRKERGLTVLLTTHFLEEAERSDRVALLHEGRIQVIGKPADLEAEIGGDIVFLTGDDPERLAAGVAEVLPGSGATVEDRGVRLEVPDAAAAVPALLARLDHRVSTLNISRPTLEDVFRRYTGARWDGAP